MCVASAERDAAGKITCFSVNFYPLSDYDLVVNCIFNVQPFPNDMWCRLVRLEVRILIDNYGELTENSPLADHQYDGSMRSHNPTSEQ